MFKNLAAFFFLSFMNYWVTGLDNITYFSRSIIKRLRVIFVFYLII